MANPTRNSYLTKEDAATAPLPKWTPARPIRVLASYFYFEKANLEDLSIKAFEGLPVTLDMFADSGAYTAWTGGAPITVEKYAGWLKRWGHLFTCAAALDVIGNGRDSLKQAVELRDIMQKTHPTLPIVPVFHSNDEGGFKYLERYFALGFDYIGISPTGAIYSAQRLMDAWLVQCFKMKPENVRYHGFGVTGWRMLRKFPFYSVDSSSWSTGFRYAWLALFDRNSNSVVRINMRDRNDLLDKSWILRAYGLKPVESRSTYYDPDAMCMALMKSWHEMEAKLESTRPLTRLYLALARSAKAPNSFQGIAKTLRRAT